MPVATTSAVQFSEKCLRQEGGGVKVDGEIIFQAPLPLIDGTMATNVCTTEGKGGGLVAEVQTHEESSLNEETSSFLNVAAPEFVPESTPGEIKDDEEDIVAVSSSNDVLSSQQVHPHKHRHFNKHQQYHPYHMIPDYMMRGPFPSHLPLPYPYFLPRHPREPLIPMSVPFGYPYPPMQLQQQSRMFSDGFPARHPQVYAAGMPSEIYMMDFMNSFPQDVQNRQYSWGNVPEPAVQSPEPDHEVQDGQDDDRISAQEITPSSTNVPDATEPRLQDNVASLENGGNQFPVTSPLDDASQLSTIIEDNDPRLVDDTSSSNICNVKTDFSEEVHPIKDNSTGQVVDTGYIHKHIDGGHDDETPSTVPSKASLEPDSSSKSELESSLEKAEVTEFSQDSLPTDNTAQQYKNPCTAATITNVSDAARHSPEDTTRLPPEDAQIEHNFTEMKKPELRSTATLVSVDNNNKIVLEENVATTSPSVATKKLPSTALGNKLNEPKLKSPAGEAQQHRVDKKTGYNNSRTSNQFSSSREINYSRTDSQTSATSGKMSTKGSTKSGPNIILRATNASEKKTYQHVDSASVNTSNKETSYSASSVPFQTEVKRAQPNIPTHSVSKETGGSSVSLNGNSSKSQSNPQVEVKKSQTPVAWCQGRNWSQFMNSSSSVKDTASSSSKDLVTQSDSVLTSTSGAVVEQTLTLPNPEHVNRQLKSLGGKGTMVVCVVLEAMCVWQSHRMHDSSS